MSGNLNFIVYNMKKSSGDGDSKYFVFSPMGKKFQDYFFTNSFHWEGVPPAL